MKILCDLQSYKYYFDHLIKTNSKIIQFILMEYTNKNDPNWIAI